MAGEITVDNETPSVTKDKRVPTSFPVEDETRDNPSTKVPT